MMGLFRNIETRPAGRLAFLIYWTIAALFMGMLTGPFVLPDRAEQVAAQRADQGAHGSHMMTDGITRGHVGAMPTVELPAEDAPRLSLTVTKDASNGWNLHAAVTNFTFVPASDAPPRRVMEGHGHVYVNGAQVARLYGPHLHLPDLTPGTNAIRVTLNTNAHEVFVVNGEDVSAEVLVVQPVR